MEEISDFIEAKSSDNESDIECNKQSPSWVVQYAVNGKVVSITSKPST
jgi:hypothetical protein